MKIILVVEDSRLLLEMLSTVLRAKGFGVVEANNGHDALKIIDGGHIDMVITDLIMPGMDGIELTRLIRSRNEYKTIPILMATTQSNEKLKKIGKTAGVTAWLAKPFRPENLTALVSSVISPTQF
jgi:two-component system, chemotaxis family, chemotaxis protein CheY